MLQELNIKNFAIIENANIEFSEGLNILSGETGAGKSLVFDAILAVLGGRLTKDDIRFGTEKLIIEAQFFKNDEESLMLLENNGIEIEEDGIIIISREYSINGKFICRINGRIVSLSVLREISASLVDLVGQHDHQKLLSNEKHLELLDSLGKKVVKEALERLNTLVDEYEDILVKRKKYLGSPEERVRAADLLTFQIEEIDNAALFDSEEDELKERRLLVLNGEKIYNSVTAVFSSIYEDEVNSVRDTLATNIKALNSVSVYDKEIEKFSVAFDEALTIIDDIKYDIKNHSDSLKFNPKDLEIIEDRLDLWNKLKRKYGKSYEDIIIFRDNSKKQLDLINHAEETIQILENEKEKIKKEYFKLASELSKTRREIAEKLEKKIVNELERLNMIGAGFKAEVESNSNKISPKGIDEVSFLLSANQGEPLKPLEKVASGGEISRVMLALKTSVHEAFKTSTMVFDEIDSGIGGRTALLVAEKIKEVSKECQIICITHLAQIASLSGFHIKVVKESDGERTKAEVLRIEGKEKVREVARMLSGDENSHEALQTAEKMIMEHLAT